MENYYGLPSFEKITKKKGKDLEEKYGKYGCKKLNKRNKKHADRDDCNNY